MFMESPRASLDIDWFVSKAPAARGDIDDDDFDDDDGDGDDDANDDDAAGTSDTNGDFDGRAAAVLDAMMCIRACTRWVDSSRLEDGPMPNCKDVTNQCVQLWRAKFKRWQVPCGNRLNVPDLLFVAACHLRVVAMPAAERNFTGSTRAVQELDAQVRNALKEWSRAPSGLHAQSRATIDACARAIVFWGSNVPPTTLLDTALSAEDVSMLTMNVNVHQNLDNRARNTDLKKIADSDTEAQAPYSSSQASPDAAAPPPLLLLQTFVTLASRYTFFASLHSAAKMPSAQPCLAVHRRVSAAAVRPHMELVGSNVARIESLFVERSRVSMPEFMRREINYTIWKCMLSIGSMEVLLAMHQRLF
jgi:hypothetical protein